MMFVPLTLQGLLQGPDDYLRAPLDRHAWLNLSGRLVPGQSARAAEVEVTQILARLDRVHPGRTTNVVVTNGALINEPGRAGVIVGLVFAATALVLLLVCSNVATLLLGRAEARRPEIALRRALGANRRRLIAQLSIEGTVPALVAAAAALGLAYYVPDRVAPLLAGFPLGVSFAPDWRVFSYTLALALVAGVVAALAPVLPALGVRAESRSTRRDHLIAQQLAVSLALLVATGLVWNEQHRLTNPSLQYDPQRVLVTTLDFTRLGYSSARAAAVYSELFARAEATPGVLRLVVSTHPPFRGGVPSQLSVDAGGGGRVNAAARAVSPGYFGMLGIRLIEGRLFSEPEAQTAASPMPVVVSDAFARSVSPRGDAIGRRLQLPDGAAARIVGIVADTSTMRLGEPDGAVLYTPMTAAGRWSRAPTALRLALLVQSTGDAASIARAIRGYLQQADPQIVVMPQTIAETIAGEAERYLTVVTLTGALAGMTLVLTLVGIYGVVSFTVARRAKEVGIRTALGARPREIVALFVWSLRWPVGFGLAAGALLAALAGWWLQYARVVPAAEVGNGAAIYGAALLLLAGTAVAATAFPAVNAARANPWSVLRNE
jgi:predicted permease